MSIKGKKTRNIAFVGNFSYKKGSFIFTELVSFLKDRYRWYIFGGIGDSGNFKLIKRYIGYYGFYEKGELKLLFKKYRIDIALLLSIWPETFSKTFFEIIDLEVPFVSFKIGFPYYVFKEYPYFLDLYEIRKIERAITLLNKYVERRKAIKLIKDFKKHKLVDILNKSERKFSIIFD